MKEQEKKKPKYTKKNVVKLSIIKTLREENRSNEHFEIMLGNLTLEEIIQLKLELSTKMGKRPLYGFHIWRCLSDIVKYSVLKHYIMASRSLENAIDLLGITKLNILFDIRRFGLDKEEWFKHRYTPQEKKVLDSPEQQP
jgi:hypothetical protein